MNVKDIPIRIEVLPSPAFTFRIPFTSISFIVFRLKTIIYPKPLEGQPASSPLEGQSREGASIARLRAARILQIGFENIAVGIGRVNVWIEWNGITWNAPTWAKALDDIAFYAQRKKTRTAVGKEDYDRVRKRDRDFPPNQRLKEGEFARDKKGDQN